MEGALAAGGYGSSVGVVLADTTVGGKPLNPARRVGTALGDRLTWDSHWQMLPGLTAGYTLNAVRRLDDVPKAALQRAGYVLHDVQLQWQPAALRSLSLALAVRNWATSATRATVRSTAASAISCRSRDATCA